MDEDRLYKRDYVLSPVQHAGGWQVHIYGTRNGVPIPDPGFVMDLNKEAAFRKAEHLIEDRP